MNNAITDVPGIKVGDYSDRQAAELMATAAVRR